MAGACDPQRHSVIAAGPWQLAPSTAVALLVPVPHCPHPGQPVAGDQPTHAVLVIVV